MIIVKVRSKLFPLFWRTFYATKYNTEAYGGALPRMRLDMPDGSTRFVPDIMHREYILKRAPNLDEANDGSEISESE
jgi:hypothetical protein